MKRLKQWVRFAIRAIAIPLAIVPFFVLLIWLNDFWFNTNLITRLYFQSDIQRDSSTYFVSLFPDPRGKSTFPLLSAGVNAPSRLTLNDYVRSQEEQFGILGLATVQKKQFRGSPQQSGNRVIQSASVHPLIFMVPATLLWFIQIPLSTNKSISRRNLRIAALTTFTLSILTWLMTYAIPEATRSSFPVYVTPGRVCIGYYPCGERFRPLERSGVLPRTHDAWYVWPSSGTWGKLPWYSFYLIANPSFISWTFSINPLLGLIPATLLWLIQWPMRRYPKGHCQQCGYDLRESPERCPECGKEIGESSKTAIQT